VFDGNSINYSCVIYFARYFSIPTDVTDFNKIS